MRLTHTTDRNALLVVAVSFRSLRNILLTSRLLRIDFYKVLNNLPIYEKNTFKNFFRLFQGLTFWLSLICIRLLLKISLTKKSSDKQYFQCETKYINHTTKPFYSVVILLEYYPKTCTCIENTKSFS